MRWLGIGEQLVERERELADVRAAISDAGRGSGSLVLVEGNPGIGKSRLCDAADAGAQNAGLRVLRARGGELEHDLTYGIARQLFERALLELGASVRRSVLSGPARLAGAALDPETSEPRLSAETGIDHGLYWLTSNLAQRDPLALIVDDAHWADDASLRFLLYLARRLEGLPAMVMVAARDTVAGPDGAHRAARRLLELLGAEPLCRRFTIQPLSCEGVGTLLSARLERDVSEPLVRGCHQVSGGNPFLIGEIARSLSGDDERDVEQIAVLAPRAVTRSVLLRLGRQGPHARAVAEALAAAGDGVEFAVLAEIVALDEDAVGAAIESLTADGIASAGPLLGFAHPIVRTAIYGDIPHWRRQQLHARAAKALSARGRSAAEVTHHWLLSAPEGNDATVERLREAGRLATERGAHGNVVRLLSRALEEPPSHATRALVLTELGEAELRAGQAAEAVVHLNDALGDELATDVRVRAAVALGNALTVTAGPPAAFELLECQAAKLDGDDALRLDAERVTLAMWVRGTVPSPWLAAELARFGKLSGRTVAERLALAQAALAVAYDRRGSSESAVVLARRALADGGLLEDLGVDAIAVGMLVYVLVMGEDFAAAKAQVARMLTDARDRGSLMGHAGTTLLAGQIALGCGQLVDAASEFATALESGRQLEDSPIKHRCLAFAESWLVESLLKLGQGDAAREVIDQAQAEGDFERPETVWSLYGRGLFRLFADDPAGAAADLLAFGEGSRLGGYEDRDARWRAWAALALSRVARRDEALALADEQVDICSAWSDTARGAALRVRALVGPADQAEPLLAEAVRLLDGSVRALDSAEVLIDHGVALRRIGQRAEARAQLERGLQLAVRCNSMPLIARARSDLAVLGSRPRRLMFSGVEGLTASERRVATMAADGMSNREIAASLFVTIKTVETHLRNVYRKLDVASRTELPALLENGRTPELTVAPAGRA